jgi:hypothetical protein
MDNDREEDTYRLFVRENLAAILTEVRATNGRVRKAEINIAILQWGYGLAALVGAGFVGAVIVAMVAGVFR